MSNYPSVIITLTQDVASESVFKMLGCPPNPINLIVVVPKGVHCKPFLNLVGFSKGSDIQVINYGTLGDPQPDQKMIPVPIEYSKGRSD